MRNFENSSFYPSSPFSTSLLLFVFCIYNQRLIPGPLFLAPHFCGGELIDNEKKIHIFHPCPFYKGHVAATSTFSTTAAVAAAAGGKKGGEGGGGGGDGGSLARTDAHIQTAYPEQQEALADDVDAVDKSRRRPQKRTLPSFSLEGKVAVVTGGARGLGLVMASALLESGAGVALVDLNGG
jgi:hypothetical protein